ncbi:hypothetical protein I317_05987 [Kwoniella heveanensis CBS 569]|nr:hypothetical protein I317_05987 [Kwoniella heveanensis CBS 569]
MKPATDDGDEGLAGGLVPPCPIGLFGFPPGCSVVDDPDEEIMELYMNLASTSPEIRVQSLVDHGNGKANAPSDGDSGGLGFLDSNSSILDISIDLLQSASAVPSATAKDHPMGDKKSTGSRSKRGGVKAEKRIERKSKAVESVEVLIQQDLGALKGRKGDTGSVLWRSSLHLARHILTQHHYPPSTIPSLLDPASLSTARVLELGSGTGLLAVLLSQICGSYTASDRLENLRLVKRNLELNGIPIGDGGSASKVQASQAGEEGGATTLSSSGFSSGGGLKAQKSKAMAGVATKKAVHLEEIDWVAISHERNNRQSQSQSRSQEQDYGHPRGDESDPGTYDLLLAVDCIYNEHLVQPLVNTLARYCPRGGKTVVWVVVELRSADVLTLFLEKWMDDPSGPWTIVRLSEDAMGGWQGTRARWVGWVGWR